MTAAEQFTLPGVVKVVRGHAESLGGVAQALHDVGDHRPGHNVIDVEALRTLLALAEKRAQAAAADLWEIEGRAQPHGDESLDDVWAGANLDEKVWLALGTLPPLVLAAGAAAADPLGDLPAGLRWYWVHHEAERISRDLHTWVRAQEKELAQ